MRRIERVLGGLFDVACGDALGGTLEFTDEFTDEFTGKKFNVVLKNIIIKSDFLSRAIYKKRK